MPTYPRHWPPPLQILAVLCIIGVLYAILFPVFQKVKENSHGNYCQSNLKQLGLAFIQYSQDSDEKFPTGLTTSGNGWAGQTYPYLKAAAVYKCPKDPQQGRYVSYAENQNLRGRNVAALSASAHTVELYETTTLNCDPTQPEIVSATGLSAPQNSTRHDGGTPQTHYGLNFLSADGSVKYLKPEAVSGGVGAVSPKRLPQGEVVKTFAVK